jgi:branched-chain amino acid transport system substrate-binding protein
MEVNKMQALLKRWPLLLVAVLAVGVLLLGACKDEDKDEGKTTPGATAKVTAKATAGAGDTTGVTDTEIKIGSLLPMSQSAAATWGVGLSKGMKAYFDYINDQGGIYGRKINFIVGDSQYTGPVAIEAARKLVEQEKVFALQGGLGTEAEGAVYQYAQDKGVPDMFLLTGETMFTEPLARTRFGFLVDYLSEGRILGQYIAENFDGKKLGILAQNDEFGKQGEEGLKLGIEDKGASMETTTEYYDSTQNDVTAQTQRLKNANVDVIAAYGMPMQAASLIKTARETLSWDVPVLLTGVDAVEIEGALAGYSNIEGTVSVVFGHQAYQTEVPGIAKHIEIMAKYAAGTKPDNLTLTGYSISQAMVQLLIQAGPDLTRESFLDAAESLCKWDCPTCLLPVSYSPTDHRWNQAEVYVKATGSDAATFKWEFFGDTISFEDTKDCTAPTPPADADKQPKVE